MAERPRLRALVLAAGRGERLRPLSDLLPKPLLPIAGQPVVAHTLRALADAGCEAAALNLHHLGDAVRRRFGGEFAGLPLTYSVEPELLGTLGALGPLRDFLAPADLVLVVNGDSFCRWPLRPLIRRHLARRADATLLVARRADPSRFGGGVGVASDGRIVSLRGAPPAGARRRVFAGAHVLQPALLERLPAGPGDFVQDLYEPLLRQGGRLESLLTGRPWHDLGTPLRYLEAALEQAGRWPWRRRAVLVGAARIEAGGHAEDAILLDGAVVTAACDVRRSILGPGVELPAGSRVEARLVTPARAGVAAGPRDSVLGALVYTPLL